MTQTRESLAKKPRIGVAVRRVGLDGVTRWDFFGFLEKEGPKTLLVCVTHHASRDGDEAVPAWKEQPWRRQIPKELCAWPCDLPTFERLLKHQWQVERRIAEIREEARRVDEQILNEEARNAPESTA